MRMNSNAHLNSTSLDVACRLTFAVLVQVITNLHVCYLPCTFLAHVPVLTSAPCSACAQWDSIAGQPEE